jgi:thiol:disulfide interchange protein DsbD
LEKFTFSDARVQAKLAGVQLLQADVTANSEDDAALLKRFSLFGPPGIIFFGRDGKEIGGVRVVGYQPADLFMKTLGKAYRD